MWRVIGTSMAGLCKSHIKQLRTLLLSNQTLVMLPLHQKSNLHYHFTTSSNKESRLMEALKKIEPPDSEANHDPEILTPEEHFYFLKMGLKCKNYVPIGRCGLYQGVILNMHLHWKKHQTLQVIVKSFTPEEVKEIASELARLTGGIVLDIHEDTIIMYRGKSYSQPPTEIMSPRITLSRKKRWCLALRRFIPRLEQDLELLRAQVVRRGTKPEIPMESQETGSGSVNYACYSNHFMERSAHNLANITTGHGGLNEKESAMTESEITSDSEGALSDIFETDTVYLARNAGLLYFLARNAGLLYFLARNAGLDGNP
ncbi:hypothetical protein MKX01_030342 [Papaver californicum]|nr:hypothetical protein MKX01_030342 [Papaver californicum]